MLKITCCSYSSDCFRFHAGLKKRAQDSWFRAESKNFSSDEERSLWFATAKSTGKSYGHQYYKLLLVIRIYNYFSLKKLLSLGERLIILYGQHEINRYRLGLTDQKGNNNISTFAR